MTSKNLFFKLIRQDFRKRIWCPLCIFILDFLVLEVFLLMKLEDIVKFKNSYNYSLAYYISDVFFGNSSISPILLMTIATAVVCGISGYTYLHARPQLDLYHSLPVKRGTLYASKYAAGVLYYLVPLLLHTLICLVIGIAKNAFTMHAFANALRYVGVCLLVFLVVYSTCILAVMLTGNLIITIFGSGVLLTYSYLISLLRDALYTNFYYTNTGHNPDFPAFSPLHMILRLFPEEYWSTPGEIYDYSTCTKQLAIIAAVAVLISICGYLLYRIRPTETAGRAMVFKVTEPVIKAMICIPLALFGGLFFEQLSPVGNSFGWFLFGVVFGFILSALLLEIIFRMDIRCAFHHCGQLLFDGVCIALIVAIFKTDALGYNTYIPSDAEIADCSISISGLMDTSTVIAGNYIDSDDYRMEHMHINDNPAILQLARKAAGQGLRYADINYYDGIEKTDQYKSLMEKESSYRRIELAYHLQNGRSVYRQYYIDLNDEEALTLLRAVYDDTDYKVNSMPLFATGWNTVYTYVNCTNQYRSDSIKLDEEKQAALLETYQSEFMNLSLDEIMSTCPVACLEFVSDRVAVHGNVYYPIENGYCIYPSFTRTIDLLRKYGFDCLEEIPLDSISAVTVTDYDYSSQLEDHTYPSVVYTNKAQIEAILQSSVRGELLYSVYNYAPVARNYTINLGNTESSEYFGSYATFEFKEGQTPDFVIQDLAKKAEK